MSDKKPAERRDVREASASEEAAARPASRGSAARIAAGPGHPDQE